MNIFSFLMTVSFIIYLFLGVYAIYLNKKASLNRIFLALNLSFAIWSLASAFLISAVDKQGSMMWNRIGSIGYCSFASLVLHFFLVFTHKDKLMKKWWMYVLIYLPPAVFIFQIFMWDLFTKDYILGKYGWTLVARIDSIWYGAFTAQPILYVGIGLLICYRWQKKAASIRERKQARVILISGLTSFILGNIANMLSQFSTMHILDVSSMMIMIWSVGIMHGIARYKFMVLTPSIAAENVLKTIIDSVILVNPEGMILSINTETEKLLKYRNDELTGKPLAKLFTEDNRLEAYNIVKVLKTCPIQNMETLFVSKDNFKIPIIVSASECKDHDNNLIGYVVASRDITKLKDMEERLKYLAHHDVLTNLPNRLLFNDRLEQAISRAKRFNTFVAIILLDLDRFKEVNDFLGHDIGDLLLVDVAKRLTASVRESDTVVRLGGDEFIILLNDMADPDDYRETVQDILKNVAKQYMLSGNKINITASAGICVYPMNATDRESLMKNADLAMYSAKNQGRNSFQLFTPSMSKAMINKVNLEINLREAIRKDELLLFYQPVIDISKGTIIGIEALIRWNHVDYGIIPPAKFIPLAEENGLILPIGEWVLRTACLQAAMWQKAGYPPIQISVNLSKRQFQQKNIVDHILSILGETGLAPECLLLEINESTILYDMEYTMDTLKKLNNHGIMIIIDDFGTGYSSLLYLRKLPIYAIKIDRFFITDIANDPECAAIASSIIAMAHNLKFKVIAEGIENDEQLESLRSLDGHFTGSAICDGAQGYLFSKPVSNDVMSDLFEKQKRGERIFS